jgi:hypothetical protein
LPDKRRRLDKKRKRISGQGMIARKRSIPRFPSVLPST